MKKNFSEKEKNAVDHFYATRMENGEKIVNLKKQVYFNGCIHVDVKK